MGRKQESGLSLLFWAERPNWFTKRGTWILPLAMPAGSWFPPWGTSTYWLDVEPQLHCCFQVQESLYSIRGKCSLFQDNLLVHQSAGFTGTSHPSENGTHPGTCDGFLSCEGFDWLQDGLLCSSLGLQEGLEDLIGLGNQEGKNTRQWRSSLLMKELFNKISRLTV